MATQRPRNAAQTRADILSAARRRFATEGFEPTTLRSIAADVGVDAALVTRYFGSKQRLVRNSHGVQDRSARPVRRGPGRHRGHVVATVFRSVGGGPHVPSVATVGGDKPDRSGHAESDACHACGTVAAHRNPRSSSAAHRADRCLRHRTRDDSIHPRQSANSRPQSGRTQQVGRPCLSPATR